MKASPFGPYSDLVAQVQRLFADDPSSLSHRQMLNVRPYIQWLRSDLIKLNYSFEGHLVFTYLRDLVTAAREEESWVGSDGSPNYAQAALDAISPYGRGWKAFEAMMVEAVAHIHATDMEFAPKPKAPEPKPVPQAPMFDQQAALAELEAFLVPASVADRYRA